MPPPPPPTLRSTLRSCCFYYNRIIVHNSGTPYVLVHAFVDGTRVKSMKRNDSRITRKSFGANWGDMTTVEYIYGISYPTIGSTVGDIGDNG